MRPLLLKSSALLAVSAVASFSFGSYDGMVDSVHFYRSYSIGESSFADFNRLPQYAMIPVANNEMVRSGSFYGHTGDYRHQGEWNSQWDVRNRAHEVEKKGRYVEALGLYRSAAYGKRDLGFIEERAGILRAYRNQPTELAKKYLDLRYDMEYGYSDTAVPDLMAFEPDDRLRPFVAYEKACRTKGTRQNRADAFRRITERFPTHAVAKKAKFMEIQALIGEDDEQSSAAQIARAKARLSVLLKDSDAETRAKAEGWNARAVFASGDLDGALTIYHLHFAKASSASERDAALRSMSFVLGRQGLRHLQFCAELRRLETADDPNIRTNAGATLRMLMGQLSESDLNKVREKIKRDDVLLAAFLAYRIEFSKLSVEEEQELCKFAKSSLKLVPKPTAALRARVAQLLYNTGQYPAAAQEATRTITAKGDQEERRRGRYVLAAAEFRLGRYASAARNYQRVADKREDDYLKLGALEALALLNERHLRPEDALKCYIKLGYQQDIAYLADIKMTPAQLDRFTREYRGPDRNIFIYTLGLRWMRMGDYDRAASAFRRIPKADRLRFGMQKGEYDATVKSFKDWSFDKMPDYGDPLQVVAKLRSFDQEKKWAKTADAKAAAIYGKAAYIYQERNLLFYSFGLWRDSRAFSLSMFWSDWLNNADDNRAVEKHNNEHECLAHVMRLCEDVVLNYRDAEVRPKALYTGAVSMEKLTDAFPNWRDKRTDLLPKSIHWLDALTKQYPDHELAAPAAKYARVFRESSDRGY